MFFFFRPWVPLLNILLGPICAMLGQSDSILRCNIVIAALPILPNKCWGKPKVSIPNRRNTAKLGESQDLKSPYLNYTEIYTVLIQCYVHSSDKGFNIMDLHLYIKVLKLQCVEQATQTVMWSAFSSWALKPHPKNA